MVVMRSVAFFCHMTLHCARELIVADIPSVGFIGSLESHAYPLINKIPVLMEEVTSRESIAFRTRLHHACDHSAPAKRKRVSP